MTLSKQKTCSNTIAFAFLCLLAAIFLIPILLVYFKFAVCNAELRDFRWF